MSFGTETRPDHDDDLRWLVDALIRLASTADGYDSLIDLRDADIPPGFRALRNSDTQQASELLALWAHTFSNALGRLPSIRELLMNGELTTKDRSQLRRSLRVLWDGLEPVPA